MSTPSEHKNRSLLEKIITKVKGENKAAHEKARLEAFLAAFPGEYCGFASDGTLAYSKGFCEILGIENIKTLGDIQSVLPPSDAAALEGYFDRLETKGTTFTLLTQRFDESRNFKFSGSQGRDIGAWDSCDILCVEVVTEEAAPERVHVVVVVGVGGPRVDLHQIDVIVGRIDPELDVEELVEVAELGQLRHVVVHVGLHQVGLGGREVQRRRHVAQRLVVREVDLEVRRLL